MVVISNFFREYEYQSGDGVADEKGAGRIAEFEVVADGQYEKDW